MTKPSVKPYWVSDANASDPTKIQEPPTGHKDAGHTPGQRPPAQWENWFKHHAGKWINYLDNLKDEAFVWTAAHVFGAGVEVTKSSGTPLSSVAGGTGHGAYVEGGGTGAGLAAAGGPNGSGVDAVGGSMGNMPGVKGVGGGTGPGVLGRASDATGFGGSFEAASTGAGSALRALGRSLGAALRLGGLSGVAGEGALSFDGMQPAKDDEVHKNSLYATNITKAWGCIAIIPGGGSYTVACEAGFNIKLVEVDDDEGFAVEFVTPMQNGLYVVNFDREMPTTFPLSYGKQSNRFLIALTNSSGVSQPLNSGGTKVVSFSIVGRQPT